MVPYTDDTDVAEEVDDSPSWVKEGTEDDDIVIEGEDIHAAEQMDTSDVIDPAKGVEMYVKSVTVDTYTPNGKSDWMKISLKPMLVVGEKGVDGKGRYKNKHFFPRILIAVNRAKYDFTVNAAGKPTQYYTPSGSAFGDYNAFLTALGFKTNPAPKNDKAFRASLVGRKVIVDITKKRRQAQDSSGRYVNTDEFENELIYKGSPKQAAVAPAAEAAVS